MFFARLLLSILGVDSASSFDMSLVDQLGRCGPRRLLLDSSLSIGVQRRLPRQNSTYYRS